MMLNTKIIGLLGVLLTLPAAVSAEIQLPNNPRNGALDATAIVVVRRQDDAWRVTESLLGEHDVDAVLRLTDLQLERRDRLTRQQPVTEQTRVLVLLGPDRHRNGDLRVSYHGSCFARVEDEADVAQLRKISRDVLELRQEWNDALALKRHEDRVRALWPYVWDGGIVVPRRTADELKKLAPVSGNYIASQFGNLSHSQRMTLLSDANEYGGDQLHKLVIAHLNSLQDEYNTWLAEDGAGVDTDDWKVLPERAKEMRGELYYGLHGLAGFRNRDDLPFIRDLATWALKHRLKQTCEAALTAFRHMPDRSNLPLIAGIWSEFDQRPYEGNPLSAFDITRTLRGHRFPATVPILAAFLDCEDVGTEARAFLAEIVGRDLGPDAADWENASEQ